MPTFPRLIRMESLATDQALAAKSLVSAEGLCTCGRFLKKTDAKFLLGQINTDYFPDPKGRNRLLIAAYCYECYMAINGILKMLKNRLAHPEPDQRRHERGA